jgi:uncharacterized protein (DUF302 family)
MENPMTTCVYSAESNKNVEQFVADFIQKIETKGFTVHNESKMAMKDIFSAHEQEVPDDFDLHMIQICKPEKAAKSLTVNLERAVLMPKFVIAFTLNGKTQVRMLKYGQDLVTDLIGDVDFSISMQDTFNALGEVIDDSV